MESRQALGENLKDGRNWLWLSLNGPESPCTCVRASSGRESGAVFCMVWLQDPLSIKVLSGPMRVSSSLAHEPHS